MATTTYKKRLITGLLELEDEVDVGDEWTLFGYGVPATYIRVVDGDVLYCDSVAPSKTTPDVRLAKGPVLSLQGSVCLRSAADKATVEVYRLRHAKIHGE